jgi:hypothetical protein
MKDERLGDWVRREDGAWWRDRVTTGPHRLDFKGHYHRDGPGSAVDQSVSFSFTPGAMPGWRATLTYRLDRGAIRLAGAAIEPAVPGAFPDPTPLYHHLAGRSLEAQIHAELRQDVIQRSLPAAWREAVVAKRRTGRRPISDLELAELADAYVRACEEEPRRPTALLVERRHESYNTLQANLRRAVDRGLLVRNGHGKAGGHLTERARTILTEAKEQRHGER